VWPRPYAYAAAEIFCRILRVGCIAKTVVDEAQCGYRTRLRTGTGQFFIQGSEIPRSCRQPRVVRITREPIAQRVLDEQRIMLNGIRVVARVMQIVFEREDLVPDAERAELQSPEVFVGGRQRRNRNAAARCGPICR